MKKGDRTSKSFQIDFTFVRLLLVIILIDVESAQLFGDLLFEIRITVSTYQLFLVKFLFDSRRTAGLKEVNCVVNVHLQLFSQVGADQKARTIEAVGAVNADALCWILLAKCLALGDESGRLLRSGRLIESDSESE